MSDSIEAKAERSIWAALKRLEDGMDSTEAVLLLHRSAASALCAVLGHEEASEHAYRIADELATLVNR